MAALRPDEECDLLYIVQQNHILESLKANSDGLRDLFQPHDDKFNRGNHYKIVCGETERHFLTLASGETTQVIGNEVRGYNQTLQMYYLTVSKFYDAGGLVHVHYDHHSDQDQTGFIISNCLAGNVIRVHNVHYPATIDDRRQIADEAYIYLRQPLKVRTFGDFITKVLTEDEYGSLRFNRQILPTEYVSIIPDDDDRELLSESFNAFKRLQTGVKSLKTADMLFNFMVAKMSRRCADKLKCTFSLAETDVLMGFGIEAGTSLAFKTSIFLFRTSFRYYRFTNGEITAERFVDKFICELSSIIGGCVGRLCGSIAGALIPFPPFPGLFLILGSFVGGFIGERVGKMAGKMLTKGILRNYLITKLNESIKQRSAKKNAIGKVLDRLLV